MTKILWDLIVQPLIYLIELVYSIFYRFTGVPGIAIIGVSMAVNLFCLPLYRMADDVQERERQKQASMARWVNHIKKHFSGDEQYMMLSAYYTEQNYHPIQALVGSISLLLQIPFFMAAYNYLSNLEMLKGASFLFLRDLGNPDAMFTVGGFVVNVMPIAMTLLNCASTVIYTRGLPLRDKVQAYGLAAVFLWLLYDSPSGLVFYWTCNQIFSLAKNVFMKVLKEPRKWALLLEQFVAVAAGAYLASRGSLTTKMLVVGAAAAAAFEIWWVHAWRTRNAPARVKEPVVAGRALTVQFVLAVLLVALLFGLLIPSAVMADSPAEFVDPYNLTNPLSRVAYATRVWIGVFLLWLGTFFFLSPGERRGAYGLGTWILAGACLVGYFAFGSGLGTISTTLVLDNGVAYTAAQQLVNLAVLAAVGVVLALVWKRWNRVVTPVLAITLAAIVAISVPNVMAVNGAFEDTRAKVEADDTKLVSADGEVLPIFHLSRNEHNVVVLFLDRAISGYLPYIMAERPELEAKFDGFTYYPNTISFGCFTNYGAPAIYGGYEYTPQAMNARSDESLPDKHNESLLVLPTIFSEAGYRTTVVDPTYAGAYKYNVIDLSIYDGLEGVEAYDVRGAYTSLLKKRYGVTYGRDMNRRFVMYGFFKTAPEFLRGLLYDNGNYLSTEAINTQHPLLLREYAALEFLPELTDVSDGAGCFVQMGNTTTHEPDILQLPDYLPSDYVDNEGLEDMSRFVLDGKRMKIDDDPNLTGMRLGHYHVNAAAYLKLGAWFDWMREQGVYDNTRIIVVADHGRNLAQFEGWKIDDQLDIQDVNPLLMVKDFDAHGFTTSDEFMTNADVPTMALDDVVNNPVNPFTGVAITMDEKTAHDQLVTGSRNWNTSTNNGNTFDTSDAPWYAVHDDIFDLSNWTRLEGDEQ